MAEYELFIEKIRPAFIQIKYSRSVFSFLKNCYYIYYTIFRIKCQYIIWNKIFLTRNSPKAP
mgnify:CR=1 FL=1